MWDVSTAKRGNEWKRKHLLFEWLPDQMILIMESLFHPIEMEKNQGLSISFRKVLRISVIIVRR